MPRDVFVSFSKEDKVWADRVCSALESAGISCWIAPRDIPPGQEWPAAIVAGIKRSANLLLILSSNSSHSRQIAREVETADRHHLNIVSFRVEDVQPPESLEYFLQNIQWIDAFDAHFDDAVLRLISAIRAGAKFPADRTATMRVPIPGTGAAPLPVPNPPPTPARVRSAKTFWVIGGGTFLVLTLSYVTCRVWVPHPENSVTTTESTGFVVTGTGDDTYSVYDAAGKVPLGVRRTNVATELLPGNYVIEMQNVRKPVTVRKGQRATLTAGTFVVAGSGDDTYSVYHPGGKQLLGVRSTNVAIELFPGNYVVEMQYVMKQVTVLEGQRAALTAGTFVVAGTGDDTYSVYDAAGKQLLGVRGTNVAVELFPGNYVIAVQGIKQPATVREGQRSTLTTGTFVVTGTGDDTYSVYDAAGKQLLGVRKTNVAAELFAGNYVVEVQNVRKQVTVREGQRATFATGTFVVAGTGDDTYSVYDAAGKQSLGVRKTNVAVELFPGNYLIEVQGIKKPATVLEGQRSTLTTGTLVATGTAADTYSVYDAAGKQSLGVRRTNVGVELFPGNYMVELKGVKKPLTVRSGRKSVAR